MGIATHTVPSAGQKVQSSPPEETWPPANGEGTMRLEGTKCRMFALSGAPS